MVFNKPEYFPLCSECDSIALATRPDLERSKYPGVVLCGSCLCAGCDQLITQDENQHDTFAAWRVKS